MAKPRKPSPGIPIVNDLGRPVQQGVYQNERGGLSVGIVPSDRVVERRHGCWNCVSFETGPLYEKRVKDCMARDLRVMTMERGLSIQRAQTSTARTRSLLLRQKGNIGLCLRGATSDDFVAARHLCDQYSARQGVSGDRVPGEGFDPLIEEIRAEVDASAPKAPPAGDDVVGDDGSDPEVS